MKMIINAFLISLLLIGCATSGISQPEFSTLYQKYIETNKLESQKTVRSFRYQGWRSLNNEYLIVTGSVSKPYLVALKSRCFDLSSATTLVLHKSSTNTLDARFDSISTVNYANQKCFIKSIYKLTKQQASEIAKLGRSN